MTPRPPIDDPRSLGERDDVVIDVVQVRYGLARLKEFGDRVSPFARKHVPMVMGWGIQPTKNRLVVELLDPSHDLLAELATLVPGDSICVRITVTPPRPEGPLAIIPSPGTDPLVICNAIPDPIPLSEWLDPKPIDGLDHPAVVALRSELANPGSEPSSVSAPWRLVSLSDTRATFIATAQASMESVTFEKLVGRWVLAGSSSGEPCRPEVALPAGLGSVTVSLDPAFPPPSPTDSEVHLLVNEMACVGGQAPVAVGYRTIANEHTSHPNRLDRPVAAPF